MFTFKIHAPVYYEHIFKDKNKDLYVSATRKRLEFNNAIQNGDVERANSSGCRYIVALNELIKYIEKNRNITLNKQPFFEWSFGESIHMSPCWKWELAMTYASLYDININIVKDQIVSKKFKEALKTIEQADSYINNIQEVIETWTWKMGDNVFPTYTEYWQANKKWTLVLKKICTINYGWSKLDLKKKVSALESIESECQTALYQWSKEANNYYPEKIMNWSRCIRAMFTAKTWWEEEKYGEAIGLLSKWNPVFKKFIHSNNGTDIISSCLESITKEAVEIKDLYQEWKDRNNTVYFEEIKYNELPKIILV
tara:strand:+ start:2628 stop:3563 length:936 start_codon:yes stop_codon:yes gene_type:complete